MAKYKIPTIQEMIDAGVHLTLQKDGTQMEPYIYMVNKNVHIIDLENRDT